MALNFLQKQARKTLAVKKRIDGETADKLADIVLADNFVSRTEKCFLKGLIRKDFCLDTFRFEVS